MNKLLYSIIKRSILRIAFFTSLLVCTTSCSMHPTEKELDQSDLDFISSLGILDPGEMIQFFSCNSGFQGVEQSGNFISDKRIAGYWIEDGNREIHSALFSNEIDSVEMQDLSSSLTYSSVIKVYKTDQSTFKIYVDGDSSRVHTFLNKAKDNLKKYRTRQ